MKAGEESAYEPGSGDQGTVYEKGFYLVGRDIEPGTWQFGTTQDITVLFVWDAPGSSANYNWSECCGYREHYECEGETRTVELAEGQYLQVVYGKAMAVKEE